LSDFINEIEFLEAVRISSPNLYEKFLKWVENKHNTEDENKLFESLLKYYNRSCSRCTPYGFFAGISVGNISGQSNIILNNSNNKKLIQLDLDFIHLIINKLENYQPIKNKLTFFPNNSLYKIGKKLRYVERNIINYKNIYKHIQINSNSIIEKVLKCSKNGATITEITNVLYDINSEYSKSEYENYITQLIENQVLLSELEIQLTGKDSLLILKNKLLSFEQQIQNDSFIASIINFIEEFENLNNEKDKLELYKTIENTCEKLNLIATYLYNASLLIGTNSNTISKTFIEEIVFGIEVIAKLTSIKKNYFLQKFKEDFYKRYEEQEIPLFIALDSELGIGYANNRNDTENIFAPLIDDIIIIHKNTNTLNDKLLGVVQSFLLKKYVNTVKNKALIMEITDAEVEKLGNIVPSFNSTFSLFCSIIQLDETQKCIFKVVTNGSATKLLARFDNLTPDLENFVFEIAKKEQELENNCILAEIIHLPENRTGNILTHSTFRDYEIPYLAKSSVDSKHQIPISDIVVKIRNEKIVLISKSLKKEIKPILSNAHNYNSSSLPIYRFLCDLHYQTINEGFFFSWGFIENQFNFFPRVIYKNMIFSLAYWTLTQKEMENLLKIKMDSELSKQFEIFKNNRFIPDEVTLADGDNELYLNLKDIIQIKLLLSTVKKKNTIKIKEFLFTKSNSIVKNSNGDNYSNEFVFSFYKQ
jgi:hypothetical protein